MSSLSQRKAHSSPPFRPSRLSVSSGPLSPAAPLTPPVSRPCSPPTITITCPSTPPMDTALPQPQRPLPWLWTCHQCGTTYPLAATRRCLSDGHYFCSGTTYNPRTGRTKRHRSCSSEFDYVGWQSWAEWKKDCHKTGVSRPRSRSAPVEHSDGGCWDHCNYPSECRWGARAYSPISPAEEPAVVAAVEPAPATVTQATKDDIVEQVVLAVKKRRTSMPKLSPIQEKTLLPLNTQTATEEAVVSPTSPLKQHYSLPTFDFPAPPQSHMSDGLFTLAEVDEDEVESEEDFYTEYDPSTSQNSTGEDFQTQPDWMDFTSSDEDEEDVESLVSTPSSTSTLSDMDCDESANSGKTIRASDYQHTSKGFEVYVDDVDMEQ
ncbi:MAG: hypothetical protein M1814_001783 [Vezdaea aestivalis]|nr:MAG: hypothetical protein M1814_001783 [Vezdaea aestivalis]